MLASSNFLVPGTTFILEWLAFLGVLYFTQKKVLPILKNAMNERAATIKANLDSAEAAKLQAEEASTKRREMLENARQEARTILEQANETADQLRDEGRKRGQDEYDRLMESAHREIDLERDRARAEVMSDLGALVLDAAEKVIGGALDAERHRSLVDEAIVAAMATASGTSGSDAGGGR